MKNPHRLNGLDTRFRVSGWTSRRSPSFPPRLEEMYLTGPPGSGVSVTFVVWDYASTLLIFADSVAAPAALAVAPSHSQRESVTITRCRQGELLPAL